MTDIERRMAAKQFAADWNGKGDEKQESQSFGWRCCKKSMAYQNRKNLLVLKKLLLWITPKQAKVQQNSLTAISAQLVF